MEFIEGVKILDFKRLGRTEPRRLGKLGFRLMPEWSFADGFVHADLHPGATFL